MTTNMMQEGKLICDSRGLTALYGDEPHKFSHSFSVKGVLRGLHFHTNNVSKKIFLVEGHIYDVLVDIRTGMWNGYVINAPYQIICPTGYAHGFLALSKATLLYEWTPFWDVHSGRTLAWNDETLNINWQQFYSEKFIISDKDNNQGVSLQKAWEILYE